MLDRMSVCTFSERFVGGIQLLLTTRSWGTRDRNIELFSSLPAGVDVRLRAFNNITWSKTLFYTFSLATVRIV